MSDRAQAFGAVADAYERVRPSYPAEAVAWICEHLPGREVVDVGAGTGKMTRALRALGLTVTPVEPDPAMRARLPGALAGRGEAVPVPDGSVDGVVYAQSWHWTDRPAAAAEARRVLRPGGVLAMAWNFESPRSTWVREVGATTSAEESVIPVSPDDEPEVPGIPGAERVERRSFDWERSMPVEDFLTLVGTWSWVVVRPPSEQAAVIERCRALVTPHARHGVLTVPMRTIAQRTTFG